VAVLSPTLTSPTARRAVLAFLAPTGGTLVEADPDAESPSARLEAYERLDGVPLAPALEIEKADLLVVLGCDLLGTGVDPVAHTAAYAARRRAAEAGRAFHHVQLEGSLSLTGAAADERVMATTAERRLVALWLCATWPKPWAARRLPELLAGALPPSGIGRAHGAPGRGARRGPRAQPDRERRQRFRSSSPSRSRTACSARRDLDLARRRSSSRLDRDLASWSRRWSRVGSARSSSSASTRWTSFRAARRSGAPSPRSRWRWRSRTGPRRPPRPVTRWRPRTTASSAGATRCRARRC
jgi:hypothetical protein